MSLFHAGLQPALDTAGNPISGARWQFTHSETTTSVSVYTTDALTTSHGSFVSSDSAGRFPNVYLDDAIEVRARLWPDSTMTGTPIKDIDPANGSDSSTSGFQSIERYGGGADKSANVNRDAMVELLENANYVSLSAGANYTFGTLTSGVDPYYHVGGQQPNILLPASLKIFDGNGATITAAAGRGMTGDVDRSFGSPGVFAYLTANVTAGDTSVRVAPGHGSRFAAGYLTYRRFGSFSYDKPQGLDVGYQTVKSVTMGAGGGTYDEVFFTTPFPESFNIATVAEGDYTAVPTGSYTANKHIAVQNNALQDLTIRNLNIVGSAPLVSNLEFGIGIQKARNLNIERVRCRNVAIGIYVQNGEHVVIDKCAVENIDHFQASTGSAYHIGETKNFVVRDCVARGTRSFLTCEFLNDGVCEGGLWVNEDNQLTGATFGSDAVAVRSTNRSRVVVRDFSILGHGGFVLSTCTNGQGATYDGQVTFEGRLRMDLATEPFLFRLSELDCILDYKLAGTREAWDFRRPLIWRRRIHLKDSMSLATFKGPPGPVKLARVKASSGVTFGVGQKVTAFYLGNGAGAAADYAATLNTMTAPGKTAVVDFFGGLAGSTTWDGRTNQTAVLISTAASGVDGGNHWIEVEYEIGRKVIPNTDYGTSSATETWSSEDDMVNEHAFVAPTRIARTTVDPASIASGATGTITLTCTGMTASDFVRSIARVGGWGGLTVQDAIPKTDACDVVLKNDTAGAIDLASALIELQWARSGAGT